MNYLNRICLVGLIAFMFYFSPVFSANELNFKNDNDNSTAPTPITTTTSSILNTTTMAILNTTTSWAENTTTTTTMAPTTTVAPNPDVIFTFNVSSNNVTCLRAQFSFGFNLTYLAKFGNDAFNQTDKILVNSYDSYTGECAQTYNTLEINFKSTWKLKLNYTISNSIYQLDSIVLDYTIDNVSFPNATQFGKFNASAAGLNLFSANKENSYKCTSLSSVNLNPNVELDIKNYQGEPFITESNTKDFATAIECPADITGTSKLVPIIVGSALAVLVVLVLIAYIIGRRKHRPGYQQV